VAGILAEDRQAQRVIRREPGEVSASSQVVVTITSGSPIAEI
jgi:hypothetical protein